MTPLLAAVLAYVVLQLAIGVWASRRIHSEADYLLAGRGLGFGLATVSLFATWFGAETCVGAAGAVYAEGLGGGRADPFGYSLCLLLMGLAFAAALRGTGAMTIGDAFRERFSPAVEGLVVVMTVPASILWAAAQIRAMGQVLASISAWPLEWTLPLAAAVVVAYTVTGGLKADVLTDVVQGVALTIGLAVLGFAVVTHLGGPANLVASVPAERWSFAGAPGASWAARLEPWLVPVLGSVTAQELAARVLASRTPAIARRSALSAAGIYLVVGMIPVAIGLAGAGLLPGLSDPEQVLPTLAQRLLPPAGVVLLVGALLSAILSTVDSNLLAAAALVSHNVVLRFWRAEGEAVRVRVARVATLAAGLVAYALAVSRESVYKLVEESSAFGGAGMFVAMLFGLRSRFGGRRAGLAAMLAGMATQLAGGYLLKLEAPFTLSLLASLAAYVGVGLIERRATARARPAA